jgi:hypothetical protein
MLGTIGGRRSGNKPRNLSGAKPIFPGPPLAKYSGASRAEVRLAQTDGQLTFEIVDDGAGFDLAATGYGTGLQGMVDRLDALGGAVRVESRPGEGTAVRGRIPARAADEEPCRPYSSCPGRLMCSQGGTVALSAEALRRADSCP